MVSDDDPLAGNQTTTHSGDASPVEVASVPSTIDGDNTRYRRCGVVWPVFRARTGMAAGTLEARVVVAINTHSSDAHRSGKLGMVFETQSMSVTLDPSATSPNKAAKCTMR